MKTALIIVDVQNDFCDGGALAVEGGGQIVPGINKIMNKFDIVVTTQDYHPEGHVSFASSHEGKNVFDTIKIQDREQKLWPDHCVQNTPGALLHPLLKFSGVNNNFVKGTRKGYDSYSGFFDDGGVSTGLHEYLKERSVTDVYVCGLALEYCVKFTAQDAEGLGYKVTIFSDLCRSVNRERLHQRLFRDFKESGIKVEYSWMTKEKDHESN